MRKHILYYFFAYRYISEQYWITWCINVHVGACVCVCNGGKSVAVWGDRLRLLSPWWIAECRCFKILLQHSPWVAKGCSLMYYFSWDWVCVCSSLKVCNKYTYKIRQRGLFLGCLEETKQQERLCSCIQHAVSQHSAASSACLDLAEPFGYAIKAHKLIAQQNSPSLIPV